MLKKRKTQAFFVEQVYRLALKEPITGLRATLEEHQVIAEMLLCIEHFDNILSNEEASLNDVYEGLQRKREASINFQNTFGIPFPL